MRLLSEEKVIKAIYKHINEDGTLDDDISCILEEVPTENMIVQPNKQGIMELMTAALMRIRNAVITHTNNVFSNYVDPFSNTGEHFETDVFQVKAYDWNTEEDQVNFTWRDIKISWYKHMGRGMQMSCPYPITPDLICEMLHECLNSIPQ